MKDASILWQSVFDDIEELVDLYLKEADDPDECEDDIIEKIYELKNHAKQCITVALQQ